ncbi:hypothetical protein M878_06260 [Streptomyces roseochromogenus subsp. oscitans DS 12.976]|uniref:Uncharacterized protein n=1 Tax=Streptomyces roseochromogenus subsp. oscitans DS 12.976 TaxID=1352936 RepID=V6KT99_STRRC|nr:hypothetical protein M878_06260 [Streptomyces roseochromogenus subsp. oscitans DS 12.976]
MLVDDIQVQLANWNRDAFVDEAQEFSGERCVGFARWGQGQAILRRCRE